tara:strand:- start:4773 stop:5984 length:1212 start_codon:yes stop_codon:yes gene_type:complete
MSSVNLSGVCEKHVLAMTRDYAESVLLAAAEKYGFDGAEALACLLSNKTEVVREKKVKKVTEKKSVEKKPQTVLPFCGEVQSECCKAIRLNHNLFTQCTNSPAEGEFCKTCNGNAAKNDGKPTYGTVEDRMNAGRMEYSVGGKKVIRYSRVMDKLNITRDQAEKAAADMGVVIAEDQFEHEIVKKGRPSKSAEVSDTESETSQKESKKAGRPKKAMKAVKSTTGDDLIASLIANAATTETATTETATTETATKSEKKPTKTDITKASVSLLKEMCSTAGVEEAKKAEMQKKLRLHYGYDSDEEKKPAAVSTPAPATAPAVEEELQHEEHKEEEPSKEEPSKEEESDEENVEVELWTHPKTGEKYLIDSSDNMLYAIEDYSPVGIWNPETENIDEIEDEDEDED